MNSQTDLKTPANWARDVSFMGLQILENPYENDTIWYDAAYKVTRNRFLELLRETEYKFNFGKGV